MKQTSKKYYLDKSKTIRKSIIIYKNKGSVHSPIIYISKPKWVTNEEFDKFINNMQIIVPNEQ